MKKPGGKARRQGKKAGGKASPGHRAAESAASAARPAAKRAARNPLLGARPASATPRLVVMESPFRGKRRAERVANLAYARACLRDSLDRGESPQASHLLYTQADVTDDDDPRERALGIRAGLAWLRSGVVAASVVYTDRGITPGMWEGIDEARRHGVPLEFRRLPRGWYQLDYPDCAYHGCIIRRARRADHDAGEIWAVELAGIGQLVVPRDRLLRLGPADVLDRARPYHCADCGKTSAEADERRCAPCAERSPPGMATIDQDGGLYGWSESNVRYEFLGMRRRA